MSSQNTLGNSGYLHTLHEQTEMNRMIASYPIHKRNLDIYLPLNLRGSINQHNTTEIDYSELPSFEKFEGIITNLENYQDSETIYESFEKELYLLKYLVIGSEPKSLPDGTKVVVLDKDREGYKTFIVKGHSEIKMSVGSVASVQYELTPNYLVNTVDSIIPRASKLIEDLDNGSVLPEQTIDLVDYDAILDKDKNIEDIDIVPISGGLYFE